MHESFDRGSRSGRGPSTRRRALLAIVLLCLAPTSALSAHAVLLESVPAAEAVVAAPSRLVLRFDGRVEARLSSVMLIGGPRQRRVMLTLPRAPDSDTLVYPLSELVPGQYRVEWRALSVDGHVADGVVRFTVIEAVR